MSLLIIRLLQSFSEITWDVDACPEAIPPPEWASSADPRQRNERAWLKSHLTMYAQVSYISIVSFAVLTQITERILGEDEGSGSA